MTCLAAPPIRSARGGEGGVDKPEQATPAAASKAKTGLGRAVLVSVISKAIWSWLVMVFGGDNV